MRMAYIRMQMDVPVHAHKHSTYTDLVSRERDKLSVSVGAEIRNFVSLLEVGHSISHLFDDTTTLSAQHRW